MIYVLFTPTVNCLWADFEGKCSHFYMWANGLEKGNARLVFEVLCNLCVPSCAFLPTWSSWLWFPPPPQLSKTYKYYEPDLYTICLHVSIAFLYCPSLSAPPLSTMKNFFLPPFLNQLFLAFEPRFILCTLACSYWLTPGSWLKTSGSAWSWGLRFLSWGRPWGMLAVVPAVYGKFPLLLKGQFGCAQSNNRISRGSFGWPCGLAHSSALIVQLWLGVAP